MSGAWTGLSWDDLDRLADYTAGALAGAAADEIARLIHTDERWAAAHAELVAAQPTVAAALRSAAEDPDPMPADVAARLDAALAGARPNRPAAVRRRRPHRVDPSRRSRRSPALVRVAAAVLVLAALGGLAALVGPGGLPNFLAPALDVGEAMSEVEAGSGPPEAPIVANDNGTRFLASGTDYSMASLRELVDEARTSAPRVQGGLDRDMNGLAVDDSLAAVATADGLARCLAGIRAVYPGVVTVVDFARFEGEPAVVVVVEHGVKAIVVAVGGRCGTDGLDELGSVSVG